MTLPRLWAFLAVALPTLAALVASLSTVDLTYQLRAGAEILGGRGIPRSTPGRSRRRASPGSTSSGARRSFLAASTRSAAGRVWCSSARVWSALIFGCLFLVAPPGGLADRGAALLTLAAFVVAAPALALRPQLVRDGALRASSC